MIENQWLQVIRCPICHGSLQVETDSNRLTCESCGIAFPVEDDIPVLVPDRSEQI